MTNKRRGGAYGIEKSSFESFINLDFEKNRSIHKIFNQDLSVQQIIRDIEIFVEQKITLGKKLLFFDEVQRADNIVFIQIYTRFE